MFKAKLFVFLNQFIAQPHAFDVVIVKAFSAFVLYACYLRNPAVLYLELDKFLHALIAEIVLAAREEKEFFTQQVSLADSAEVLFVVELPFEGPLTLSDEHEEVSFASKFKPHFLLVLPRTFDLQVFKKLILDKLNVVIEDSHVSLIPPFFQQVLH